MRSVVVQNSFVSGEVDPEIYDRLDIDQYERAARKIYNFRVRPQGGVVKRGGTKFLGVCDGRVRVLEWVYSTTEAYAVLVTPTTIQVFDTVAETFVASISGHPFNSYDKISAMRYRQVLDTTFIVHEDIAPRRLIKFGGYGNNPIRSTSGSSTLIVTRAWHGLKAGDQITFSGITTTVAGFPPAMWSGTFTVSLPTDHTFAIQATQNATASLDFGGSSLRSWVLGKVDLKNIPQVDFNDSLSPQPTRKEVQRVSFLESWAVTSTFGFIFGGYKTQLFNWAGSGNMDINAENATRALANIPPLLDYVTSVETYPALLTRRDFRVIEPFQNVAEGDTGVGIDLNGNPYLDIEFRGKYTGKNVALILGQVGGNNPRPSIATETITEADTKLEPVWSELRGWPRSVEFFEGRLCFGGSKSFPASFWASVSGDYTNFQVGDAHDDEAIAKDVDVNSADAVEHLVSTRALMAMTRRGEYYQTETPMVPESATFKQQTSHGTGSVQPCKVGGCVYFVQRNGKAVRRLLYSFQEDAFSAEEVSVLSRHLLTSPVDMATQAHPQDGDYIYVVNGDGTMPVLAINKDQQVAGWSTFGGYGKVLSVCCINDSVYITTDRSPLVQDPESPVYGPYYFEKLTDGAGGFDCDVSASISGAITAGWTFTMPNPLWWFIYTYDLGFGVYQVVPIDGLTARVTFSDRGDYIASVVGKPIANIPGQIIPFQIDRFGMLKFTPTADMVGKHPTSISVGTEFYAELDPLPLSVNSSSGNMMLRRKRVSRLTLDGEWSEDSGGSVRLEVQVPSGQTYTVRSQKVFGEQRIGRQASLPMLGWSRRGDDIRIRHVGPGSCTIRGIEREIEVTGHLGEERD